MKYRGKSSAYALSPRGTGFYPSTARTCSPASRVPLGVRLKTCVTLPLCCYELPRLCRDMPVCLEYRQLIVSDSLPYLVKIVQHLLPVKGLLFVPQIYMDIVLQRVTRTRDRI